MLTHPTLEKLSSLKLTGMLEALEQQMQSKEIKELSFEERLGMLLDAQDSYQRNQRFVRRLQQANLRQSACIEDVDFKHQRCLDKSQLLDLASGRWIQEHNNVLISGSTGIGKTYLACALAQMCCREGRRVFYSRLPRLLQELAIARADGRYIRLLASWARMDLLVIDDFGLSTLSSESTRDLLEVLDDRYNISSTLVVSQLTVKHWHQTMEDPTLADAVLDRLVHNAYKIELEGESIRKKKKLGKVK
jgi:DNA replication protein DnaC